LPEGGDGNGSNEETASMTELHATLEKRRILKMFVVYAAEDDVYTVKVNSVLKFNMVAKFVATGVSFCLASKLYQTVKEETGMGVLGSVSEYEVAQICRIVCSINLQCLKEVFKKVWAFSVLQKQKDRLLAKVSEEDIENVDAQFGRLRIAYRDDEGMRQRLDQNHSTNK
jgi:hypothetical protein